eukprot:s1984_g6.t1
MCGPFLPARCRALRCIRVQAISSITGLLSLNATEEKGQLKAAVLSRGFFSRFRVRWDEPVECHRSDVLLCVYLHHNGYSCCCF